MDRRTSGSAQVSRLGVCEGEGRGGQLGEVCEKGKIGREGDRGHLTEDRKQNVDGNCPYCGKCGTPSRRVCNEP